MQPSVNDFPIQLSKEVEELLHVAADARGITPHEAFGRAIDQFDPSGVVDTDPGAGSLRAKCFTLTDAQVAQSIGNAARAGLTEEQAAVAAIRQLAATTP